MTEGEPTRTPNAASMVRSTTLISLVTLGSRLLGLVREQIQAALLGSTIYGEAFQFAFRIPNLLRDLFAEGALSVAFQTVFAKRWQAGEPQAAFRLANLLFTLLLVCVGVVVVAGICAAPVLVRVWAPGFTKISGQSELTASLLRIMMPFLLFVSWSATGMAMLNTQKRFLVPAFSSVFFNLSALILGSLAWVWYRKDTYTATYLWTIAVLLGGVLQWASQLPALWRQGYRIRLVWDLRDPGLRTILTIMAPVTLGLAAMQVNLYISSSFSSQQRGSVVWLTTAFRLLQVPVGLFGVAAGTVALSSYMEAGHVQLPRLQDTLRRSLRTVLWLTLPTMIGMWLFAPVLLRLLFQHGIFVASDTAATAWAFQLYAVGLVAYTAVKVVAPAFYALQRTWVPVVGTVLAVGVNVAISVWGFPRYGYQALALAMGLGSWANVLLLCVWFQRSYGGLLEPAWWLDVAKIVVAALVTGFVLFGWHWVAGSLAHGAWWKQGVLLLGAVGLGTSTYAGVGLLLGIPEIRHLWKRWR